MDDDDAPGVPEWVVTYGDMMSLLLTFFIMLVSLSDVVADQKYRAILSALQQYIGYRSGPIAPPGKNFPLNSLISHMESLGSFTNEKKDSGRGGIRRPAIPGHQMRVYRTREGIPNLVGDPVEFDARSTRLSQSAIKRLDKVIETKLAGKPNKIVLQAGAAPDPTRSHAEQLVLTYERGRSVLAYLRKRGIARERIRITAGADLQPRANTGDKRSENLNRVEIYILDAFASDFVGARETSG